MKPTLTLSLFTALLLAPLAALHAADDATLKPLERSPISNRWGKVKPTKIQVEHVTVFRGREGNLTTTWQSSIRTTGSSMPRGRSDFGTRRRPASEWSCPPPRITGGLGRHRRRLRRHGMGSLSSRTSRPAACASCPTVVSSPTPPNGSGNRMPIIPTARAGIIRFPIPPWGTRSGCGERIRVALRPASRPTTGARGRSRSSSPRSRKVTSAR